MLKQYGVPFEVLDRDGFVKVEPALALTQEKFVGALRLPGDETGDCFKFTQPPGRDGRGAGRAASAAARTIQGLELQGGQITGVRTDAGVLTGRPLRGGAGQLLAAAAGAAGHAHSGLSGQGLLDHRADHRRGSARPNRPSWTRPTRWP